MNRKKEFDLIKIELSKEVFFDSSNAILAKGDSLEIIKKIPDNSVSLILTDPPYHSTKKKNIFGDTSFKEDNDYIEWLRKYSIEWRRILKANGSIFLFCSSAMSAKLEMIFSEKFNVLSHIVWTKPNIPGFDGWKQKMKKEALRQWYAHSERILFLEVAAEGNLNRSPFANFLREIRKKSGLSAHKLTEITGEFGKVNHGGAVSNWETGRNVPSREQYAKISTAILDTGNVKYMPPYEDIIRPFKIDATKEFTDIWTFPSVKPYKDKHPAEKPIELLIHAIEATTYPNDIVLDCFAGSGSTTFASLISGRKSISIEIESKWLNKIVSRLNKMPLNTNKLNREDVKRSNLEFVSQINLF